MKILVCIKRVPQTGAKIVLTQDEQEVETRNLGFTIGPHEECAVEAAIQLVEKHGGDATVATLGEEVAVEQLRGSLSMGIDHALLLESGGGEWDPMATASALVDAVNAQKEAGSEYDILLFGNEAADSGDYQVGIRVAHALGLPCVTGVKSLEIDGSVATARREATGGWEQFHVTLPAVFTVKEGINLPRYPSLPGRIRAKKKPINRFEPVKNEGGPKKLRLETPPEQASKVEDLGSMEAALPRIMELLKEMGVA